MTEFWSRSRLIGHLTGAGSCTGCFKHIKRAGPAITWEEALVLDEADMASEKANRSKGWGRRKALLPSVKLQGPLPFIQGDVDP